MCKDIIFAFSSTTLEGYPVIGMGVCESAHRDEALDLFAQIDKIALEVDAFSSEINIDNALNEKIASISPDYVLGLALSINIPGAKGPTGGIVGKPNYKCTSANGGIDYIGNGYCVVALPGGPGLLVKADKNTAKSLFTDIVIGQNSIIPIHVLEKKFKNYNVDLAIIVKDGTGDKAQGMIISYYFGEIGYLRILN